MHMTDWQVLNDEVSYIAPYLNTKKTKQNKQLGH